MTVGQPGPRRPVDEGRTTVMPRLRPSTRSSRSERRTASGRRSRYDEPSELAARAGRLARSLRHPEPSESIRRRSIALQATPWRPRRTRPTGRPRGKRACRPGSLRLLAPRGRPGAGAGADRLLAAGRRPARVCSSSWSAWASGSGRSSPRRSPTRTFNRAVAELRGRRLSHGDPRLRRVPRSEPEGRSRRQGPGDARRWPTSGNTSRRSGDLVVGAGGAPGRCSRSSAGRRRSFATSGPTSRELVIRIGEGLADRRGHRPTRRRWPRPSRRCRCTPRSPASRPGRFSTGRGCRPSSPRPGPRSARHRRSARPVAGGDGPGPRDGLGLAGLRGARRPGRAVRRPRPRSRADRAG